MLKSLWGMRVGANRYQRAIVRGTPTRAPVNVEAVWVGIQLNGSAHRCGFFEDGVHVDGVRFARQ